MEHSPLQEVLVTCMLLFYMQQPHEARDMITQRLREQIKGQKAELQKLDDVLQQSQQRIKEIHTSLKGTDMDVS